MSSGGIISTTVVSAVGTGTGDQTATIQELLNAVPASGGVVRLIGSFLISGSLKPLSNTVVDGGGSATITQTAKITPIWSLTSVQHVTIRNFNLIGYGAGDYTNGNTASRIIDITNSGCSDIRIENNSLSNYGHSGVAFSGVNRLWIVNNTIVGLAAPTIAPPGGVSGVTVTAGGTGYTSPPAVAFSAPTSGTTAAGSAVVTAGAVTAVTIINAGTGYSVAPTVSFTGGGGSGATGTAAISPGNYNFGIVAFDPNVGFGGIYIEGNDISGGSTGINSQDDVSGWIIAHNRIHDIVGQHCIYLNPGQRGLTIDSNTLRPALDGIKLTKTVGDAEPGRNIAITNNRIISPGNAGINLGINAGEVLANGMDTVSITGNIIDNSFAYGINFNSAVASIYGTNFVIRNNNISECTNYGIIVTNLLGSVSDNSVTHVGGTGIQLGPGTGQLLVVDGNTVVDAGNNQAYNGGSVGSTTLNGLYMGPGTYIVKNNVVTQMAASAQYTLVLFQANVTYGALNFFDSSKPQSNSGATVQYAYLPASVITYNAGDTAPSIAGGGPLCVMQITNAAATTITNFTSPSGNGQVLILIFRDSNTTVARGSQITLDGGVNFVSAIFRTLQLVYYGGVWYQTGKVSING